MKTTLIFTALCAFTLPMAHAQNQPNRESAAGASGATGGQTDPAPPASAGPQTPNQSGLGEADRAFIMKAGTAGMVVVKMAEMATTKSSQPEVEELAAMIVKDHTTANMELAAIAKSKGVEIPPTDGKEHRKHGELSSGTGHDFDTAFLKAMDKCHEKDINLFESSRKNLQDPELKAFVTKTLPVLREHAKQVESVRKSLKSGKDDKGEKDNKDDKKDPVTPGDKGADNKPSGARE
jgi:putative membrane protein